MPVTTVSTGDLTVTTSPSPLRMSSSQKALLNKDWLGSPSPKLPFTFSRTANALFKQLQQWPNYNAEKDDGCTYTKTKLYKKFQRKQMAAEHAEATETIGRRHLEMRNKQRGALAAAVAMTERELPTAVDEEIKNIFIQISDKLYLAWKERR